MAHNSRCGNATSPRCTCSGCGGSRHGWPGSLLLATGSEEQRDALRSAADQNWLAALDTEGSGAASQKRQESRMQRAAVDRAVADIVDWLAEDADRIGRVEMIGDRILDDTLRDLDMYAKEEAVGNRELLKLRKTIPGHFWCSLLAELTGAADTAHKSLDSVPGEAKSALLSSGDPPDWGEVQRYVAGFTLAVIWAYVKPLVSVWDLDGLIRIMRVLAVLICPDPGRHKKVARLCLSPLTKDVITQTAETRLGQSLGAEFGPGSGI